MKACPQCKQQFTEADEFCPHHGVKLLALSAVAGGGAYTVVPAPAYMPGADGYDKMLGTVLDGRYLLTSLLGEGGMGVVFRARHQVIEKMFAIKILKRDVARDQMVVKRFLQEAKAASRIGHPAIVDMTDFGTLPDGTPYAVMEYIDGSTLSKAMRLSGPMTAARALPIVAQIAKALGAAHEKGIVHRDLKPENIFLVEREGRRDVVKIVDFGIAKVAPLEGMDSGGARLTRAGAVFGTPEYMAPEQAAGRPDTDLRVDVYALGVILYEMLTGRLPHKAESLVGTLAMVMLDPVPPAREVNPRADISDALDAVLMKMLAKDKAERYDNMYQLLADLEAVADGVPLEPMAMGGSSRGFAAVRPRSETAPPVGRATGPASSLAARTPDAQTVLQGQGPAGSTAPTVIPPIPGHPETAPMRAVGDTGPIGVVTPRPGSVGAAGAAGAAGPATVQRKKSKRALVAALGVAAVAIATLGIAIATRGGSKDQPVAGVAVDAGATIATPSATIDAAPRTTATTVDATVVATAGTIDAGSTTGRKPHDVVRPGDDTTLVPKPGDGPLMDIVVRTKPAGGELFIDDEPAGSDGTTFNRPKGTSFVVRCKLKGHKPGRVTVAFDGKTTDLTCTMKKEPRCRRDLQNPFDPCPE